MQHPARVALAALPLLLVVALTVRPAAPGAALPATAVAAAANLPRVETFTPTGTQRGVRQATARFSAPMVALGGGGPQQDPFVAQCSVRGEGRWIDATNWAYEFAAELPAGERCSFTLRDGLTSLDGRRITPAPARYAFDTGGPAIVGSLPYEGTLAIDEQQVFLLKPDAVVSLDSVRRSVRCVVDGLAEQLPVEVLEGEARAAVLRGRRALGYGYRELVRGGGEGSLVLLRCGRPLPPGARMQLFWGRGVATRGGVAATTDQTLQFQVRPMFSARAECTRANAQAGCLPLRPVSLRFTSPVPRALAAAVRLRRADGTLLAPEPLPEGAATVEDVSFRAPFPPRSTLTVLLPAGLRDDAGRPLENAARFPLELRVEDYPPLAKFAAAFGILEAGEGGVLPVTLRNLEGSVPGLRAELPARRLRVGPDAAGLVRWLRRVDEAQRPRGTFVEGTGERPGGSWREDTGSTPLFTAADGAQAFALASPRQDTQVVGIPLRTPGLHLVEVESRILGRALLGRDQSRYVATAALVTNLAVHFKWGREGSLAWVTRLDNGLPAAADVTVVDACDGRELWRGAAGADGIARIEARLGTPAGWTGCEEWQESHPLLVVARAGEDFSFVRSDWKQGIDPGDFSLTTGGAYAAPVHATVLDRALLRPGETLSMKHYLRRKVAGGIAVPAGAAGRRRVVIRHEGSGQEYAQEATFDAQGIATTQWRIPAEAALGSYAIAFADGTELRDSGRFTVAQFRLPTMRASIDAAERALVRPQQATLDLHVAYLSGGGAAGLPVKLRTTVLPAATGFPGYEDYAFDGVPVTEGVAMEEAAAGDFDFETGEPAPDAVATQVRPLTLDAAGAARATVDGLPRTDVPLRLVAEMDYADANGEVLTATTSLRLLPSALNVGLRRDGWTAASDALRLQAVVLDLQGRPVAGRRVDVAAYHVRRFSFRKRLVGGFYGYETTRDTRRLPVTCGGVTDARGRLDCELRPGVAGEVLLRAQVADDAGRVAGATTSAWLFDASDSWFGGSSSDRMDVLPEREEWQAGQRARFQVRMPFRRATALVTVEREGVLSAFVTTLDGNRPVVEVPVTAGQAPNAFVSVLAVRGRVPGAKAEVGGRSVAAVSSTLDLNRPAWKLGITQIRVGWAPHRLDVRVEPERAGYRPRETVRARVRVARADGGALPAGTEVAIAAVDAALLQLAPNASQDLLAAMMGERGIEVYTSTAQMQVVGKRTFGRKAVATGGGGGREPGRELFDSLLAWRPRVPVGADGSVVVDVPLNDSLSEFRIVAVASGGPSHFGTGSASVTSTQDVILQSGLPQLLREGDQFTATFSLRNTGQRALTLDVSGSNTAGGRAQPLAAQRVVLEPGRARDVSWRVTAPAATADWRWEVQARAGEGAAADRLRVTTQVVPAFPVRTRQATLVQAGAPLELPVAAPAGAVPGRGGLELTLRARLADGQDAVREYLERYPYDCIEQQVSRAVVLEDRAAWDAAMRRLPAYLDRDGLLKFFPVDGLDGDDALTAYVLAIAHEAGFVVPDELRARMLEALQSFAAGRVQRRGPLSAADLTVRRLAALDALSRHDAADPQLLASLDVQPGLWPTSALIDWLGVLRRVEGVPDVAARRRAVEQELRTRLSLQGTTLSFATEARDALWWLMVSGDSNANRLLLAVLDLPAWRVDVPRLARGTLGRQRQGRWGTTVANAWGMVALRRFSAAFESAPVAGTTRMAYGATTRAVDWAATPALREATLPWQPGPGTLRVTHEGGGAPWVLVRATAALQGSAPVNAGYRIRRSVTPVEQQVAGRWTRGDVVRVRLEIDAQSDRTWVVVDDPLPAGARVLGGGLGGDPASAAAGTRGSGAAWLAYAEHRLDSWRAFFRWVPKGTFAVEYTARLNNPGQFQLPSTRVEAMYAPEVMGELPLAPLVVAATDAR